MGHSSDSQSDLLRGLDALPSWIIDVVVVGTRILAVVVTTAGLVWALWGRRWRLLVTVVAGGGLGRVARRSSD